VSQPDGAQGFVSPDNPSPLEASDQPGFTLAGVPLSAAEAQAMLAELSQVRILEHERVNRIYHLEQALDQALTYLDELRQQLQEQSILEAQLAKTEAFASVQQQAIARLKQQLQQLQHTLGSRDQVILSILGIMASAALLPPQSTLVESQIQEALDTPKQLTLDLEIDGGDSGQVLELEMQLTAAQQHIQDLSALVTQLETHLKQANAGLDKQQVLELTLRQTKALVTERNTTIAALQKDLAIAQIKVEELETQLAKQLKVQAKWQQNCQELEEERDRSQTRLVASEKEIVEMQEQILQQARQASEYEAAVQHWKDRYLASQRQIIQLKDLLEHALPQSLSESDTHIPINTALIELLTALQDITDPELSDPLPLSAVPSPRFNKLDLPDFLIRRRNYRSR
jgi:DNA repair exonuclease SbcCD ATPase subunit